MVGVTRGLVAEPQLLAHARAGDEHLSRTCTACNHCIQQVIRGSFGCAINPATARERRWGTAATVPAPQAKRVVVVGGGPAGVEAARVAAVRGHAVTLLEREDRLGGQYRLWSALPGREGLYDAIAWYGPELARLGVDVRMGGGDADVDDVLALDPEAVIVATGSRYERSGESGFVPAPIPGADRDFVYTPEQILDEGLRPAGKVLLLDDEGLNAGVGVAQVLAANGSPVELVTRWLHVAHNLFETFELPLIVATLRNLGVTLRPQTYVREIGPSDVTVYDVFTNMEDTVGDVDAVVLCTMRKPRAALADALAGKVAQLFSAGDASAPRDHATAFYEGALFARMVGEPDAPRTFTEAYFRTDWEGAVSR
jgi:pyruvate/2-oxoglutarate dehydrogenase complex dihydrolipoamide dehydrogenase (E3) component